MTDPHTDHPDELLPWYVNGTLEEAERNRVEMHLAHCPRCREELTFLEGLRQRIQADTPPSPGETGLWRLRHGLKASRRSPVRRWQVPLAAAAGLILGLVTTLLPPAPNPDRGITLLGETRENGATLQVEFTPKAREGEIRALLQELHAVIIHGPSAAGLYRVRLEGITPSDDDAIEAALARLRSHPELIRHVARD